MCDKAIEMRVIEISPDVYFLKCTFCVARRVYNATSNDIREKERARRKWTRFCAWAREMREMRNTAIIRRERTG